MWPTMWGLLSSALPQGQLYAPSPSASALAFLFISCRGGAGGYEGGGGAYPVSGCGLFSFWEGEGRRTYPIFLSAPAELLESTIPPRWYTQFSTFESNSFLIFSGYPAAGWVPSVYPSSWVPGPENDRSRRVGYGSGSGLIRVIGGVQFYRALG